MTTWVGAGQICGIERDEEITNHSVLVSAPTNTIETTYSAFGTGYCVKIPCNTATTKALSLFSANPEMGASRSSYCMFRFHVGGGATTATATILSDTGGNYRIVRLNNSTMRLEVYDAGATLRAHSQGALWSTSALTYFDVLIDTIDVNNTKIAIWDANGTLVDYQITGISRSTFFSAANPTWAFGDNQTASSKGADLYGGVICRYSLTAADNPLWQRYPMLKVGGGQTNPAAAMGGLDEWTGAWAPTTSGANRYQNIYEANAPTSHPGSDGNTSYGNPALGGTDDNKRETFKYSAANPISTGGTPWFAETGFAGRLLGANKLSNVPMIYDSATATARDCDSNYSYLADSTNFRGVKGTFDLNANGAAWARADFDLNGGGFGITEFGSRTATTAERGALTTGSRVSSHTGLVVVYQDAGAWLGTLPGGAQY